MIQSTDAFPLNFGFTGELRFLLVLGKPIVITVSLNKLQANIVLSK